MKPHLVSKHAEIFLRRDEETARPTVEINVPSGTTLEESRKLENLIYEQLAPEILGIGPCANCRSGVDILIKEKFEDIIRINLESFEVLR